MGFAYLGIGIGGALVPRSRTSSRRGYGWHVRAAVALGLLMIVLALPFALFVREHPDAPGAAPATAAPIPGTRRGRDDGSGRERSRVFTHWTFPLLLVGSMCSIGAVGGTMQNLKLFLSIDRGFARATSPACCRCVLAGSIIGRLLMGWLADRYAKKYVMLLIYALVAATVPLFYVAPTLGALQAGAFMFGIGLGGDYMIIPLMAAELYGVRDPRTRHGCRADRRRSGRSRGAHGRRGDPRLDRQLRVWLRCSPGARHARRGRGCAPPGEASAFRLSPELRIRMRPLVLLVLALPLLFGFQRPVPSSLPGITVLNGPEARDESLLAADLPPGVRGETFQLRNAEGQALPAQLTRERRLLFVVSALAPGERRQYTLEPAMERAPAAQMVEARRHPDRVEVAIDGQAVFTYRGERTPLPSPDVKPIFSRGGYIHPVRTPAGRVVTDDYPPDHLHHHGIWFAWTSTEFQGRKPDFWNMGDGTGTVEYESILDAWSGPFAGGLRARHRFVDLGARTPVTVLTELWDVTAYGIARAGRPYRAFDIVSVQDMVATTPLVLPEYRYGGIGLRGHRSWLGATGAAFLTSEGRTRLDGHATRARWCVMSGQVDGQPVGIAVLDHPQNYRHPQPMRIHPTEPFFNYAPMQAGRMEIVPGTPYRSRYRFIVFDGSPDAVWINRLWKAFAEPPRVTIR